MRKWPEIALPKIFDRVISALAKRFWLWGISHSAMIRSDKGKPLAERIEAYGVKQKDKETQNRKGMVTISCRYFLYSGIFHFDKMKR